MISAQDRRDIERLAARYGARRVLLFGSGADPDAEGRDIDLGVEGIRPGDFFRFYGELIFTLSKPVDLVDLSDGSRFSTIVLREGIPIYG